MRANPAACATCHAAPSAFTDPDQRTPTSQGVDRKLFGNRNTPTAMYAAYSPEFNFDDAEGLFVGGQFWDGRAATLEEQAKQPFLNPIEMANPDKATVVAKLRAARYAPKFRRVFGPDVFADTDAAYERMAEAIAAFERTATFSRFSSKYDAWLAGRARLSAQEHARREAPLRRSADQGGQGVEAALLAGTRGRRERERRRARRPEAHRGRGRRHRRLPADLDRRLAATRPRLTGAQRLQLRSRTSCSGVEYSGCRPWLRVIYWPASPSARLDTMISTLARPCPQLARPTRRMPEAARRAGMLVAVLWLAAGCAHNIVYDENRDKQAQALKKTVAEAHLAGTVNALEKTFAELAAREEARALDRAGYLFDLELRTVARAPSLVSTFTESAGVDGLVTVVRARLAALGIDRLADKDLEAFRVLDARMTARARALEVDLIEFHGAVGHRFAGCAEIYAASTNPAQGSEQPSAPFVAGIAAGKRALVPGKFQGLFERCRAIEAVRAERDGFFAEDKLLRKLYRRVDEIERQIAAYDAAQRMAEADLAKATANFRDSGVGGATEGGRGSKLELVEQQAQSLGDLVQIVAAGNSVFGLAGAQVVAAERLKRLETILGVVAGTPSDGKVKLTVDEQVSLAIVRDLPMLADEADKLLKDARKPRVVPFLAAIEQQRLVVKGFEAAQAAKRKQAAAVRGQLQSALQESVALVRVLQPLTRDSSWAGRSVGDLGKNLAGADKRVFERTLAIYADEVRLFRAETAVWAARATAAQYEEGLARSKFAAQQWDALIDTMAAVLADYYAAGIKTSDLAEFFKALGLVVIGIGVAQ
jgi:hypothetical protein